MGSQLESWTTAVMGNEVARESRTRLPTEGKPAGATDMPKTLQALHGTKRKDLIIARESPAGLGQLFGSKEMAPRRSQGLAWSV